MFNSSLSSYCIIERTSAEKHTDLDSLIAANCKGNVKLGNERCPLAEENSNWTAQAFDMYYLHIQERSSKR